MSSSEMSRDFKGIWIPKEIWLDTSLDFFDKTLFSEIHSLDGPKGCFASNEYFCKFFNTTERTLQRALKSLKERGYITIESFDGRQRIIRSHIKKVYDKFDTSAPPNHKTIYDNFDTPAPSILSPPPLTRVSIYDNKEDNKETPIPLKGEAAGAAVCLSGLPKKVKAAKPPADPKVPVREHVEMTEKELESLKEKFPETLLNHMLDKLNHAKGSKGYKYKSDYHAIFSWVYKSCQEELLGDTSKQIQRQAENKMTPVPQGEEAEQNRLEFQDFRRKNWKDSLAKGIYLHDSIDLACIGKIKLSYALKDFKARAKQAWIDAGGAL